MQHFYHGIHGWFNFQPLYQETIDNATHGQHFVEVGAWKGKSSAFMAVEIINSNKNIEFDIIDTWEGSSDETGHMEDPDVIDNTLFETFCSNLSPVQDYINVVRSDSVEAAGLYEDESVDFVLLDGGHSYEQVKADITAWLPKVKKGGILAGDDYGHVDKRHLPKSGLAKAVDELLPNANTDNYWWTYKKEE